MINSIGLPNKGLEGFLAEDLPQLAELPVPLIVSVMATGREEFARSGRARGERDEVAAIELNVSCPNVHSGLIVGEQPGETEALLEALRPLTEKPLIVKLTPNVADPAAVAVARRAGRGRRGLADQHAEGERVRPAHGGAGARRRARRPLRAGGAAGGAAAAARGRGRGRDPGDRHGRDRERRRRAPNSSPRAPMLVAVGTENFRDPRAGSSGRRRSLRASPAGFVPAAPALNLD